MLVVIHLAWKFDFARYPHPTDFAHGSEMNRNCAASAASAAHITLSKIQQPQTTQRKTTQEQL
ncbi:MAG TPA: hypothetical protein VE643_06780 [Nitrososphaeraceae archaeon]|nr:hypothetical protein [Nitrososphaeraceae archaeon]